MITYSLNDIESKAFKKFYKKHSKTCKNSYELVTFTATGIGYVITVKCPRCEKEKDVTDYNCW
jgi:hypothetical protein